MRETPREAARCVVFWRAERVSSRVWRVWDWETPRVRRRDMVGLWWGRGKGIEAAVTGEVLEERLSHTRWED